MTAAQRAATSTRPEVRRDPMLVALVAALLVVCAMLLLRDGG